ncbi:MAG: SDR family NAD(P)-dependent oxidoreductase [Armatimonadota bacterium]
MFEQSGGLLEEKVAIVTGGASGIGRATAELFARHGARVLIVDRDEDASEAAVTNLRDEGIAGDVDWLVHDISEEGAPEEIVGHAADFFGAVDILFNNAGVHGSGASLQEKMSDCLQVNLQAAYAFCIAAYRRMRETGGSIINNASVSGPLVGFASPHYDASKAGLVGLTRHLASQWGRDNVRVNAICPGFIQTPFIGPKWTENRLDMLKDDIALGRLGTPEEIAQVALFLASEASSYITGAAIPVDGGWTIHFHKY